MANATELRKLAEQGKQDYEAGRYEQAIEAFGEVATGFARLREPLDEAEQKNNLSVALLQMGRLEEALEAVRGTDQVFAEHNDIRRQGMAVNNRAVTLDEMGRVDEALAAYEQAAELLRQAGEGDLRATVLKAAAAIELKRGQLADSGMKMLGALGSTQKPNFFQKLLRSVLRIGQ